MRRFQCSKTATGDRTGSRLPRASCCGKGTSPSRHAREAASSFSGDRSGVKIRSERARVNRGGMAVELGRGACQRGESPALNRPPSIIDHAHTDQPTSTRECLSAVQPVCSQQQGLRAHNSQAGLTWKWNMPGLTIGTEIPEDEFHSSEFDAGRRILPLTLPYLTICRDSHNEKSISSPFLGVVASWRNL